MSAAQASVSFGQLDDALEAAKRKYVDASVEALRSKGTSDDRVAMFRQACEYGVLQYNAYVMAEMRALFGLDSAKKGGEA